MQATTPLLFRDLDVALDRLAIDLHPTDVREASKSVAAAGREVDKADFIDLAQVDFVQKRALGLHFRDIKLDPAHIRQIELGFVKVVCIPVCVVPDEPVAIRQLDNGPDLVESRGLRVPLDPSLACEVDKAFLVTKHDSATSGTKTGPDVGNSALVVHRH